MLCVWNSRAWNTIINSKLEETFASAEFYTRRDAPDASGMKTVPSAPRTWANCQDISKSQPQKRAKLRIENRAARWPVFTIRNCKIYDRHELLIISFRYVRAIFQASTIIREVPVGSREPCNVLVTRFRSPISAAMSIRFLVDFVGMYLIWPHSVNK